MLACYYDDDSRAVYLSVVTGIVGYWLPSPYQMEKKQHDHASEAGDGQAATNSSVSSRPNASRLILQLFVSLLVIAICLAELAITPNSATRVIFVPVVNGITGYWMPSPGMEKREPPGNGSATPRATPPVVRTGSTDADAGNIAGASSAV